MMVEPVENEKNSNIFYQCLCKLYDKVIRTMFLYWSQPVSSVATVSAEKNENFSRSGKSQGIFLKVKESLWYCQSQWKVGEFCFLIYNS